MPVIPSFLSNRKIDSYLHYLYAFFFFTVLNHRINVLHDIHVLNFDHTTVLLCLIAHEH